VGVAGLTSRAGVPHVMQILLLLPPLCKPLCFGALYFLEFCESELLSTCHALLLEWVVLAAFADSWSLSHLEAWLRFRERHHFFFWALLPYSTLLEFEEGTMTLQIKQSKI